ncbi:MAG: prepilin-type N-terminal cleavage/methylation domain-containing protein [Deltaproteobacteria bacterium]|nr:prepilin-type N-terminal cleavage/methylation domain-containing protein [Deltaproteobacteria bacterium]
MNLFDKKTSDNKGFTLIEIIAVLIILGIMAAVAVSRMGSNSSDLIPQTDILKTHLRFAQLKALSDDTSTSWGIVFTTNSSYTLTNIVPTGTAATINLPSEDSPTHTFASGVTCTTTTVAFDSWGSPGTTNVTITLTQGGASKSFRVYANTGYIEDI